VIIPHDQLNPETLDALIEEFITREGAVHGQFDSSLASQIARVKRLLQAREAVIQYDEADETCTIVASQREGLKDKRET